MDPGQSQAYDDQSRQPLIVAINVLLMIVLTLTISLRISARIISRAGLWWDDWLAIAGFPIAMLPLIFDLVSLKYGFGKHASTLTLPTLEREGFYVYILELFYNIGLGFFKLSFLALYIRVFPQRWMYITCCTLGAIICCWLVSTEFALIFRCIPIRASWEGPSAGKCSPQNPVLFAQSIPTIIFDLTILVLPVFPVWNLQMPKSTRVAVICIFLVGGLITAISIARIVSITRLSADDLTWNFVDIGFWSATEPVVGLLCCSLSTYSPLFKIVAKWLGHGTTTGQSSLLPSGTGSSRHPGKISDARIEPGRSRSHKNRGYARHFDEETLELTEYAGSNSAYGQHGRLESSNRRQKNPDKDTIQVRHDVSVSQDYR